MVILGRCLIWEKISFTLIVFGGGEIRCVFLSLFLNIETIYLYLDLFSRRVSFYMGRTNDFLLVS